LRPAVSLLVRAIATLALGSAVLCGPALASPPRPDRLRELCEQGRLDEARQVLEEDRSAAHGVGPMLGLGAAESGSPVAVVLLVDFSDTPADTILHGRSWFDHMLFDSAGQSGSMRSFYMGNSYGTLDITGKVYGWFRLKEKMSYYADAKRGMGAYPRNAQKMIEDAVAAADPFVDFSQFDNDGPDGIPSSGDDDSVVDCLLVVHAGQGFEWTMNSADIHSHAGIIRGKAADGVTARPYATEPEEGQVGTFAHEMGHLLGLPDLYDLSLDTFGLGMWSLMAYGMWGGGDGSKPVGLDAWSKAEIGFVTPASPAANAVNLRLPCVEDGPDVLRLWSEGQSGSQYFLVENRRAKSYDSYLSKLGEGLLVYHVDERYRDNSSEAGHLVSLEQADGRFDLDQQRIFGFGSDAGDPFPGSSAARTFSWWTVPDNRSNEGLPTEVTIRNIRDAADTAVLDVEVRSPVILFESSVVEDGTGDGDGEPDPGERVALGIRFRNHGIACSDVRVTLSSADPFVTLVTPTATLSLVEGNALSSYLEFEMLIDPTTPQPHNVEFGLDIGGVSEVGPYASSDRFVLAVPLRRLAGWPQRTGSTIFASPAVADMDGDGAKEIVVGNYDGLVYAWKTDGRLVPGWPVALGFRTTSKAAICDIDVDGAPDVVIASQDGRVHALGANGVPLPGWPQATGGPVVSTPALGDIDDDGIVEIICGSKDGKVYAWNEDGTAVGGWPVEAGGQAVWMSPAVADCDEDYVPEVVVGGYGGQLYVFEGDGSVRSGWPILFGWGCGEGAPAMADFDGDGRVEIVVSGLFSNSIYLVDVNGVVRAGWPRWAYNCSSLSPPIPADIDGDGLPEIAVATSCGTMVAWNADGSKCQTIPVATSQLIEYCEPLFIDLDGNGDMDCLVGTAGPTSGSVRAFTREGPMVGFPIGVEGAVWATPVVGDLEDDGYAEIVLATTTGDVHVWRFVGARGAGKIEWSQSRGDLWNTGLYGRAPRDNVPLPDLVVTLGGMTFEPERPRQGDVMVIGVRVANVGHDAADRFAVRAFYDQVKDSLLIGTVVVPSLAAKRDTTIRFQWEVPGGSPTRLVCLAVDGEDVVLERSELNNLAKLRFYLSVADLSVELSGVEPFPPAVGESLTVFASVANIGADVARRFEVSFYDSAVAEGRRFARVSLDSLAPGDRADLEVRYKVGRFQGDAVDLVCAADPDRSVLEYYLSNNLSRFKLNSGVAGEIINFPAEIRPSRVRSSRTGLVLDSPLCACVFVARAQSPNDILFGTSGADPDVSWNTAVFSSEGDIAGYDLAAGMPFVVSATADSESQPAVWGANIVWISEAPDSARVMLKRGSAPAQVIRSAAAGLLAAPDISRDIVVWVEGEAGAGDIWGYDLGADSVFAVRVGAGDRVGPKAWGSIVVWEDRARDAGDIHGLDTDSGRQFVIAEQPYAQQNPDIWGDLVVWQDMRSGNWDIYGYSLADSREFPVSRQVGPQVWPCLSESTVVWVDRREQEPRLVGLRFGGNRAVADVRSFEALSQDALIRVAMEITEREDAVSYKLYRYAEDKWEPGDPAVTVREYFTLDGDSVHVYPDTMVTERTEYHYRLGVLDAYGEETVYGPVDGHAYRRAPKGFLIGSPYPNPFLDQVNVSLGLPRRVGPSETVSWPDPSEERSEVEVEIYSVTGRLARTVKAASMTPGYYRLTWDGRNDRGVPVSSGVYYFTVTTPDSFGSRKVILLR
jgi:immune inhibitor A